MAEALLVHEEEVLAHDQGGLDEETGHAQRIGLVVLDGLNHLVDADLDAEVDDFVAVVGENNVDEVLANVVDVTLDGGEHHATTAALVRLFHKGLEVSDSHLHCFGTLQHERQLHLAAGEEFTDGAHAHQQNVVDDFEWSESLGHGLIEVIAQASSDAVNNATLQSLAQRKVIKIGGVL